MLLMFVYTDVHVYTVYMFIIYECSAFATIIFRQYV